MKKNLCYLFLTVLLCFAVSPVFSAQSEEGFVSLFNGKDLTGWTVQSGLATYSVQDGAIVGVCKPGTKTNTFLVYEKQYGNFILKLDFKAVVPGNSGIQFRSHLRDEGKFKRLFGYQCEIDPSAKCETGRIYDEGRRGFQHKLIWLDRNTPETLKPAQETYKAGDWNSLEIQCVGPSIRTWLNGVQVSNIFDYYDLSGLIGLQIHAGKQGSIAWRNIRIKDLGESKWEPFFVGEGTSAKLAGARFVLPNEWTFVKEGYLKGVHDKVEKRDGLVVSDDNYADFAVKVTYRIFGGNSGLYFRAEECEKAPWLMRGFQNEIADDKSERSKNASSGIWHTAGFAKDGTPIKGRGWLGKNEEFVAQLRLDDNWNTICTVAIGKRIVNFMNGFQTLDFHDDVYDQPTGKVGLQLHGGAAATMWFKDFEIIRVTPEMRKLIER